jgi:hypothetical protein
MVKKVIGILLVLSLLAVLGCSSGAGTDTATTEASVKTVREAEISSAWAMKQLEINLDSSLTIWLILADGDKVDGYYYLESGDGIGFKVAGNSLIYESKQPTAKTETLNSDRFSFTASKSGGIAYGLTFNVENTTKQPKGTAVFLEIIYPVTGSINFPLGTK